ncbi:hypothetical protein M409DRAFT_50411 [Zasmidium cellare ATCC 36951]|uniref:Right handed beta helix domain-containing protein n=1 Tax=Zasmidium cellare ATCC 36951 TaxID=1080233 RepID=A0A6A6CX82_ZASCE|nr:uncharacterized protein M409DRAFT_50411 [Zasmidium cellare ATCC 36951]KAF2171764.1 hypothetical protein M409DRAFT_50411 [Zasmidium cellare ATCC 36951]
MARLSLLTALSLLASLVSAQCGGTADATVDGSSGAYTATAGSTELYSGASYLAAIQAAIDGITTGQTVAVLADGSIGDATITIDSGKTFEGCGTIDVGYNAGHGAIEVLNAADVSIPTLTLTGAPYFGLRFYGVTGLSLGDITMNLSGGIGIRFDRDEAANVDVSMGTISVTGASSHAVETWNIDGLTIDSVVARDCGECGLLLQNTRNAQVGLVDGDNVGGTSGYATLRFANTNGLLADGSYDTNVYIDRVVSSGGGRGIFCVSESGGAEIGNINLSNNGNNAILIENCYNLAILAGTVTGGGEVRLAARAEFANNRDVSLSLEVNGNTVREEPCGENSNIVITGDAAVTIC